MGDKDKGFFGALGFERASCGGKAAGRVAKFGNFGQPEIYHGVDEMSPRGGLGNIR